MHSHALRVARHAVTYGTQVLWISVPCPRAQGDEDEVVPPNQAVEMFEALKGKGVATALVMFKVGPASKPIICGKAAIIQMLYIMRRT